MEETTSSAVIRGSIRTLAQLLPGVGGALAQAWEEWESFHHNKRVSEFFEALKGRLEDLERSQGDLQKRIRSLEDLGLLLERTVASVAREVSASKRQLLLTCFVSVISTQDDLRPAERLDTLEALDHLNDKDIFVLREFAKTGAARGDVLSETGFSPWCRVGGENELELHYEETLGPIVLSTAKLEARGLIVPDSSRDAFFTESGDSAAWYNLFRRRVWRLMPAGRRLLNAIAIPG